jgi:hypothetical protein
MSAFHEFLAQLLDDGKIVFRSARPPEDRPRARDVETLARAFESYQLTVAGPPIRFDPQVAAGAAEFVRQASFALVSRAEGVAVLEKRLRLPGPPVTASQHLSADLTLRYVPQIVRRSRGLDPFDPLAGLLEKALRFWPLSGVLSEGEEGRSVALDFDGHAGLMLMYAERLIQNDRPQWRPEPPGLAWEYYELVLAEHGRSAPEARTAAAPEMKRTHGI